MLLKRETSSAGDSTLWQLVRWALTWACIIGGLGIGAFAFLGSMDFGHDDAHSKPDIAKLTVSKFAYEAYPQWSRDHHGCPRSLDDLVEYMDSTQTRDPWGQPYRMYCTTGLLIVASSGEDRIPNTADDRWSNR